MILGVNLKSLLMCLVLGQYPISQLGPESRKHLSIFFLFSAGFYCLFYWSLHYLCIVLYPYYAIYSAYFNLLYSSFCRNLEKQLELFLMSILKPPFLSALFLLHFIDISMFLCWCTWKFCDPFIFYHYCIV